MLEAIRYCLANLGNFNGRDARATFWYYVLFLVIINLILGLVIGMVFTAGSMGSAMEAAAGGASEAQIQAQIFQDMSGSLSTQMWLGAAVSLITLVLFIAAFVRRLRDAALPVAIAAIPIATTLFTTYSSFKALGAMQTAMTSGDPMAINEAAMASAGLGLVGWFGYLVVSVCGVIPTRAS